MNDEDIRKIIDDTTEYDEARVEPLTRMLGDFYSRRMAPTAAVVWVNCLIAIAISAAAAALFFRTSQVKDEIMYAAIFLVGWGWLLSAKTMGFVALYRNSIAREIKRLEIRLLNASGEGRRQARP